MNTEILVSASETRKDMLAIEQEARNLRSQAMREVVTGLVAQFERLAAKLRPNRRRSPQVGAWA